MKRSRSEVSGLPSNGWSWRYLSLSPGTARLPKPNMVRPSASCPHMRLRQRQAGDLHHRRGHHHAGEPAAALGRRPEQHHGRHRVAERVIRRGAVRQHHRFHEVGEVFLILGEIVDVTLERIPGQPARAALPAPIEHRHGKAAPAQLAHHLEIFLDELGAAGKDADRAAPLAQHRLPAGEAQAQALAHLDISRSRRRAGSGSWVLRRDPWERAGPSVASRLARSAPYSSAGASPRRSRAAMTRNRSPARRQS